MIRRSGPSPCGRSLLIRRGIAGLLAALVATLTLAGVAAAQEPDPLPHRLWFPIAARTHTAGKPEPANGAVDVSPNAWLAWQTTLPPDQAAAYRWIVYLNQGDVLPSTAIAFDLQQGSFDPATFTPGATYSWRVIGYPASALPAGTDPAQVDEAALSAAGALVYSPTWRFTVEDGQRPTTDADLATQITVPAGEFRMGCDPSNDAGYGCRERETPLHTVYLDAYRIDKYEVTNRQYRACWQAGACPAPRLFESLWHNAYYLSPAFDFYPVLYVSWWDAKDYCEWVDKRLPTEAEWEKAARGPIDTRPWPWGTEPIDCTRANYTQDSSEPWTMCVGDTQWVGSFPLGASPYGLMDVSGNAFEWVHDKWDRTYYNWSPSTNPQGPDRAQDPGEWFVIRGGSYRPRWWYPRTFNRHWGHHGDSAFGDEPFYRNNQVGFRCAADLP